MPTIHYICWVDDRPAALNSFQEYLSVLNGEHDCLFQIDDHHVTDNLDTIARNITEGLIFFIDYNLKENDGTGMDGHDVIAFIRKHNQTCPIVFYSSKETQENLRMLIAGQPNVICVAREQLRSVLKEIAEGSFGN